MIEDARTIADYILNLIIIIGRLEKRVAELTEELRKQTVSDEGTVS